MFGFVADMVRVYSSMLHTNVASEQLQRCWGFAVSRLISKRLIRGGMIRGQEASMTPVTPLPQASKRFSHRRKTPPSKRRERSRSAEKTRKPAQAAEETKKPEQAAKETKTLEQAAKEIWNDANRVVGVTSLDLSSIHI